MLIGHYLLNELQGLKLINTVKHAIISSLTHSTKKTIDSTMVKEKTSYRQDIFGSIGDVPESVNPLIPAATVVLLRTRNKQPEVLMLQKSKGISFGGMWVFPGGKIDESDNDSNGDLLTAAKNAAVREAKEETGVTLNNDCFVWFSHWTPPITTPKRFSTWFFAAEIEDQIIQVDGGEILKHKWITPREALARHEAEEIELVPPTWITLYQLSLKESVVGILESFENNKPMHYKTKLMLNESKQLMAIWHGDDAYTSEEPNEGTKRHRLIMKNGGFIFENNAVDY